MNLQENEGVNIENFSVTTAVHEAAFETLGQREKNYCNILLFFKFFEKRREERSVWTE